jgi:hypothetical protein
MTVNLTTTIFENRAKFFYASIAAMTCILRENLHSDKFDRSIVAGLSFLAGD